MKYKINVKQLLIFFYIILPLIFFSIPLFFIYEVGYFTVHFYSTYVADSREVFTVLIGHLTLGMSILYILKNTNYNIQVKYQSKFFDILLILTLLLMIISNGIISMLVSTLFIIIIGNIKISNLTFFIMLLMAFANLLLFGERYVVIFILIIWSIKLIASRNIGELLLLSLLVIFILIFILQPLKYNEIPFSNFTNPIEGLAYLLQHVFPIYYTAFLANTIDFTTTSLISEFIPFAKSLSGELGIVEKLAIEGLPDKIINEGGRLGSNSSMYFSVSGVFILSIMFFIIKSNLIILKSQILTNSLLMYFIIQGPYFIRRSFASFTIDIILIIFWVLFISGIILIVKNKRVIKYECAKQS